MRVLLVSDSHGRNQNMEKVIRKVSPIDLLIHLGDLEGSEGYLETISPCPVEMVAGNNDFFSRLPREKVIQLGKHKIFMTHGHNHYVNYGNERLREAARQNGCDFVFFGHIHRPVYDMDEDVTVVNPGSISLPRQDNRRPSYAMVDVDRKGEIHISICYI
ncbi:MAG: metallophosphoesterase [Coprococcus sp.]